LDSARYRLYQNYLSRAHAAYDLLQLAHVEDIIFQADPFAWAATQEAGLHVFCDVADHIIAKDAQMKSIILQYFGNEVFGRHARQISLPAGYVVGSAFEVQRYVEAVVADLVKHPFCQKKGADEVVHNVLVRQWSRDGVALDRQGKASPIRVHVNSFLTGPVWTGGNVARGAVTLDGSKNVINQQHQAYAVLHQYDEHDDLWKTFAARFLKGRTQQKANAPQSSCSGFDITAGDMRGFDISHAPADRQEECCLACNRANDCGAFIFSPSRKHCWFKGSGGAKVPPKVGEDLMVGSRR